MQHETTPNDNQTALPEPKFGEWLRGIYASESNPHRDGMYVRTIRRTGKLNPGVHYEVTDGNGKFWQYPAQSVERLATPPAVQPAGAESAAQPCEDDCHEFVPFANACIRCGAPYTTTPAAQAPAVRVTDELVERAAREVWKVDRDHWLGGSAAFLELHPSDYARLLAIARAALEAALGQGKA